MRAIMSDKLREILLDPKRTMQLEEGISKLGSHNVGENNNVIIHIGGHTYQARFVEAQPKKKKLAF